MANSSGRQPDELLLQVDQLLNIGIALSAEKDDNRLLQMIVTEARRITGADAGTLYLREPEGLSFKIMQNETMKVNLGGGGEEINLPPVPLRMENVSAYVALTGKTVNIPDVYQTEDFDFSGPRQYDKITGYHTKSMLVIPLENHEEEVIGVLQLINAIAPDKSVIPFAATYQKVVESLASQAAIALTKAQLLRDIEQFFNSFVEVMATAIDALTPYNANHTRRVALYSEAIAKVINETHEGPFDKVFFDKERTEQLVMAAWLHDIGKVATPLSVMNKATRLDAGLSMVLQRLDYFQASLEAQSLRRQNEMLTSGQLEAADAECSECKARIAELENIRTLILKANDPATFVDDDLSREIKRIGEITFLSRQGVETPLLAPEEVEALCVRTGTLTPEERGIIEDHVRITERLLEKIPFIKKYKDVPALASMHHEHLDGKGYPRRLSGDEIPLESRILALTDIFDALTAGDRPYKKAMTVDEALRIIGFMVKDGKLDCDLAELFRESRVWERIK